MPVLYLRDKDGKFVPINTIKGADGKSAYQQAVDGGFLGTEEEFIAILNGILAPVAPVGLDPSHIDDKSNPHNVTAEQIGLGNVDNTSDEDKPVSKLQEQAIKDYALAKTGDTMSGALSIDKPTPWGQVVMHSPEGNYRCVETDEHRLRLDVRDGTDENNRVFLDIYSNSGASAKGMEEPIQLCKTVDGVTETYSLMHTGMKPMGTYTGTGLVGEQKIQTGGVGNILIITSSKGFVLVFPYGGFSKGSTSTQHYGRDEVRFENGVLTFDTNVSTINGSGTEFTWQVL